MHASNSRVSVVSKIVLTLSMMSEAQVENVVFFGKWSIVAELPVTGFEYNTVAAKLWFRLDRKR